LQTVNIVLSIFVVILGITALGIIKVKNIKLTFVKNMPLKTRVVDSILYILITTSFFSLSYLMLHFLSFFKKNHIEAATNSVDLYMDRSIWLFLVFAVVVPFVEEIYFRGIFLHLLEKKFSAKIAILLSSLLFGLLHFDLISKVFDGIMLCILRKKHGLALSIFLHAFFNALGYFNLRKSFDENSIVNFQLSYLSIVVCSILVVVAVVFFAKFVNYNKKYIS